MTLEKANSVISLPYSTTYLYDGSKNPHLPYIKLDI